MRLPDGYTIRVVGSVYQLTLDGHHVAMWSALVSRRSAIKQLRRIARLHHKHGIVP